MITRALVLALSFVLSAAAPGANPPPPAPVAAPRLADIDFPGGAAADYVNLLRAAWPEVNFVLAEGAADVSVPQIRLTRVGFEEAALAPFQLTNGRLVPMPTSDRTFLFTSSDPAPAPPKQPRFDLTFEGGTISDYARAVRAKAPEANIVVAPEAAALAVPPLELRGVTVFSSVEILNALSRGSGAKTAVITSEVTGPGGGRPVYTIAADVPADQARADRTEFDVWSLGEVLDAGAKPEDVLAAVEVAHQAVGPGAVVKYHPATRILIAKGNVEHISVISRVIDRLSQDAARRRKAEGRPPQ